MSIVFHDPVPDLLVMAPFISMSPNVLEISSRPDGEHLLNSMCMKYIDLYIYVYTER